MKRPLFAIISSLSLLLFVTIAALWLRGQRVGDRVTWVRSSTATEQHLCYTASGAGVIGIGHVRLTSSRLVIEDEAPSCFPIAHPAGTGDLTRVGNQL